MARIILKSESEIAKQRRAADLVGRTLAEVGKNVEPGITTWELDRIAESFIRANGGTPAFLGHGTKKNPFPATLCASPNDQVVHGIPTDEPLKEGDLLSIDCGVFLDGFVGDSAYTFAVGEVSELAQRLCLATYESLMIGVEECVHGNRLHDIGNAVAGRIEQDGFGIVRDLVGHGVGRSLWEPPQVPHYRNRTRGKKLKAGMTICIEPMINAGGDEVYTADDGWTIFTDDGSISAHYEHMVAVGRGKPDVLSTFAYIEDAIVPPFKQLQAQQALA
jgi:methionyl aminopeptidase